MVVRPVMISVAVKAKAGAKRRPAARILRKATILGIYEVVLRKCLKGYCITEELGCLDGEFEDEGGGLYSCFLVYVLHCFGNGSWS